MRQSQLAVAVAAVGRLAECCRYALPSIDFECLALVRLDRAVVAVEVGIAGRFVVAIADFDVECWQRFAVGNCSQSTKKKRRNRNNEYFIENLENLSKIFST